MLQAVLPYSIVQALALLALLLWAERRNRFARRRRAAVSHALAAHWFVKAPSAPTEIEAPAGADAADEQIARAA
jgi:hypothetical protein